jgi:NAD(P)-dependent dehydrogenase (short-subunit alcohol dehydrogenase family)
MLAERGARVAILGDDADVLSGAAAQACADSLDIIPIPADVRQEKEVSGAVSAVVEHFGTIRILINNAAIQPYGTVDATPPSTWDSVMSVNLRGAYLASHFVLPHMRASGGGAIVNIASVQGIATQNRVAAYSTSKGGLLALTRAMAVDHATDGIRVNAVCPGCIDAPMTRMSAAQTAAPGGVA